MNTTHVSAAVITTMQTIIDTTLAGPLYDDVTVMVEEEPPKESYWEYKAYLFILKYVTGVVMVLGIMGNILTLIVLQSKTYQRSPSNVLMAVLAVCDMGYIASGLPRQWILGFTDGK